MMRRLCLATSLAASTALFACAHAPAVRLIQTTPGVSLEVVDWGGNGPPLVFLAGLGNTAHVFDDFAPQFTDDFHVFGITRRGFGASAGAPAPNNLDTLVADLRAVLDTLGVRSVVLAGHSIAGEEMTRFAEIDRARCASLVYIDAAYDRSGLSTSASIQAQPPAPYIRSSDFESVASVRALVVRVMGVEEPESEIRATSRFDRGGHYLGERTPDSMKARIVAGVPARYDRATCRALAIYATPDSLADVVPYYRELDSAGRVQATAFLATVDSVVADGRSRFGRLPHHEIVEIHGGNHFVFLQRPSEVARAMRAFLARSP